MKVKCRGYIGYLEGIEAISKKITGIPINYRVYINVSGDFIDLRNVELEEIEFVNEEQ